MNVVAPFEGIGASVRRKEDFRFLQGTTLIHLTLFDGCLKHANRRQPLGLTRAHRRLHILLKTFA